MTRTVKTKSPKEYNFGDGKMTGIDHFVYEDKKRVGTVLETRFEGKTWFEAKKGNDSVMSGNVVRKFDNFNTALKAV